MISCKKQFILLGIDSLHCVFLPSHGSLVLLASSFNDIWNQIECIFLSQVWIISSKQFILGLLMFYLHVGVSAMLGSCAVVVGSMHGITRVCWLDLRLSCAHLTVRYHPPWFHAYQLNNGIYLALPSSSNHPHFGKSCDPTFTWQCDYTLHHWDITF